MTKNKQLTESSFVTYLQLTELCLLPPVLDPQSGQILNQRGNSWPHQ